MILKFEFKKLFSNRIINIIVLIAIILNAGIFYNVQKKDNGILINNIDKYHELSSEYKNNVEGLIKFNEELSRYSYLYYMKNFKENEVEDTLEYLLSEDAEVVDKYTESIYGNDDNALKRDEFLISTLKTQLQYINSYSNYLGTIEKQKKDMLSVSIFNKKGTFSYNNIIKTAEDFKPLENIQVKLDIEEGIRSISNYYVSDIIIILLTFIICVSIFSYERETNIFLLIKANKKGRGPLIISKILTLIISLAAMAIIIYGSIILITNKLYGFGDLSRSIQSVSDFRGSNIVINIETYLKVFILTKVLGSIIIGIIFALIFQLNKNIVKTYVLASIFLLISFLCFIYIPANSYVNIFKYINIFTFLFTPNLLGQYVNVNLFSKPVNLLLIYKVFNIFIVPMIIMINVILFIKEKEIKKQWINFKIIGKIKKAISKKTIPLTLFFSEVNKLIFQNKLYLIFIIVFIGGYKNLAINNEVQYTTEQAAYKYYLSEASGEITDEKKSYLEEENMFFDNTDKFTEDLEIKLKNNEITEKEYTEGKRKISYKSNVYRKSFNDIYNQYIYLNKLYEEQNINGQLVDMEMGKKLFMNENKDLSKGIYISILLIIFLSNIFSNEYKSGAINLIHCSKNRNKLFLYKYLISFIIITILYIAVYIPDYINIIHEYGTVYFTAPIQSIPIYFNFELKLNILQFLILTNTIKFIGIGFISMMILNLSILSKNQLSTTILGTSVLIPSIGLSIMGIKFLEKFSFVNIFNLNSSFSLENNLYSNVAYFLVLFIITIFIQYITFKVYRNKKIFKKRVYHEVRGKRIK